MREVHRKRILIVDDDKNIVETLKIRLQTNGYEVITAYDGLEGMEKAKRISRIDSLKCITDCP